MRKLSNLMLLAAFTSTLFYAMSYPYIYAETLKVVPSFYIGLEQILCCLGTAVFCFIWNKHSDKLFRFYRIILWGEMIADMVLFSIVLITGNLNVYFLMNVIIYALITRNLACGGTKMRAKVNPSEKSRERFDNNNNVVVSVATLIGAGVAIAFPIPLKIMFILALIGNCVDNVIYLYIYRKLLRKGKGKWNV